MRSRAVQVTSIIALLVVLLPGCGGEDTAPAPPPDEGGPANKSEAAAAVDAGKADWSLDWCERSGWYGDGECDWFCPRRDVDCDADVLGPDPQGDPLRYPVVLAHGFDASPANRWGYYRVAEALEADGHRVIIAQVPPYHAVTERAAHLARFVDTALEDAARVNIIAHSMGGLDSRHVISQLGYGDRVASLTTISTPHRGSAVADVALALMPGILDEAVNALAGAWGRTYSDVSDDADLRAAMFDISLSAAADRNAATPDVDGVYYQSWAGVSAVLGLHNGKDAAACDGLGLADAGNPDKMHASLVAVAAFTAGGIARRPNDGMVTVLSAKWGVFQGCIPADHLDEVGQPQHDTADENTGFDHVRFYRNVAFNLAAQGF
ncbi:MAG: triacylglycerol lipase [Bradymonadia bacterium]|jgi:triacylglycerol lipase